MYTYSEDLWPDSSQGSTSKGGGVHFHDEEDANTSPECSDETQPGQVISAILEPDGAYLVKVSGPLGLS